MESTTIEIDKVIARINEIQKDVYSSGVVSRQNRAEWNANSLWLRMNGFVIRKRTVRNGYGVKVCPMWVAIPIEEVERKREKRLHNSLCDWVNIDMTPNDGRKNLKGNCTTRALSYIFKGIFNYREIEHEQYRRASEYNASHGCFRGDGKRKIHRNTTKIWDSIAIENGYVWIEITNYKKETRETIASFVGNKIKTPFITSSANHVAVIDCGKVIDSWDSRRGRVKAILIRKEDSRLMMDILSENGIRSQMKISGDF